MATRKPVMILLALLPVLGWAQQFEENKLLVLMPELRQMPAPDWLQEGTRVTYFTASATVPAERFYWYKDERGEWRKGDMPGPAGMGFMQYQCVYRSPNGAVGTMDMYGQDPTSGVLVPQVAGGAVDPAGAGACWANPAALAKADRFQSKDFAAIKMPYPLEGKTYQSIRFHYVGETAVDDYVYDLESGVLLFHQHVALSADRLSTLLAQTTFMARRQVPLPAQNPAAPAWMADAKQMQYQGQLVVQMAGMPQFPMPMAVTLQKTGGGARWASYQATQQMQGQMPNSVNLICGAAGLGGEPWMSPDMLKGLQPGQVLDQDPQTQVVTGVGQVGGPMGPLVVIVQEGRGFRKSRAYDPATGKLILLESLQQVGQAIHQTQLQLVQ